MKKKTIAIDMDGVLVDFAAAIEQLQPEIKVKFKGRYDEIPGFYNQMLPLNGAIKAYKELKEHFDIQILSTAPWDNPSAWSGKIQWVQLWLDGLSFKNLTLTHHKELFIADYLIDDRTANGASEFQGELILFGSSDFPDWPSVIEYLKNDPGNSDPKLKQISY